MVTKENEFGFTLIELLVTTTLIFVLFAVSFSLINSILKGTTKTELIKETKQTGSYALSIMDSMIRQAVSIQTCTTGMTSITINNQDNSQTVFTLADNNISSSGANLLSSGYTVLSPGSVSVFDCNYEGTDSTPLVSIKFTLEKTTTSLKSEDRVKIPFETSVSLRRY